VSDFDDMLERLTREADDLATDAVARVRELLERTRADVSARVIGTEWDEWRAAKLRGEIERSLRGFAEGFSGTMAGELERAWAAGGSMVDATLSAQGFSGVGPVLDRTMLGVLQGYSAQLIKGLASDAVARIDRILQQGVSGVKTPYDAIREIGRNLDEKGFFRSIFGRAEAIARTEMARVHAAARQARMAGVVERNPHRRFWKRWLHSGFGKPPRVNHMASHGETVAYGDWFSNGIPYPHAPGLPAREVVRCRCTHVLIVA